MAGVEDRVKGFLEAWRRRKTGEIPSLENTRCTGCGIVLEDGNFALVDDDLICLSCMKGPHEK